MPVAFLSPLIGAGQALIGGSREHRAENDLRNLKTPTYSPNQSILDYYNEALDRYHTSPYASAQYQAAQQAAQRAQTQSLSALQDRRSALGGVSAITQNTNDAMLKAGVDATNEQNQRFGQLGGATEQKAADDRYGFQINKIMPYQAQYQLLGGEAAGGAAEENAGISNAFTGISNYAMEQNAKNMYGVPSTGATTGGITRGQPYPNLSTAVAPFGTAPQYLDPSVTPLATGNNYSGYSRFIGAPNYSDN